MPAAHSSGRWRPALAEFLRSGGCRGPQWTALPAFAPWLAILLCGSGYGAVMASYHGFAGERLLMIGYGALKVPMLSLATLLAAVPCFYVLNMLAGVGDDFGRVWNALVDYQLSVALQLAVLAPATLLVNVSNGDYRTAQAWSTLLFAATAWNARRSLRNCYAELTRKNSVHRALGRIWFGLYAFVGIQMAWDLRPFVGHPAMPVQFFRDQIGNAYVEVFRLGMLYLRQFVS